MTLRWDLLLPTKNTLLQDRNPVVSDSIYDYGVIWVNRLTNSAWLLKNGTVQPLPPTGETAVDTTDPGGGSATLDELQALIEILLGDQIEDGENTGDIIRWNEATQSWESKAEPIALKQLNLTPRLAALEDVEGGMFYKSTSKAVMICTEGE